ncbi:Rv3235 family protein [Streptomyces sp. NPDC000345]|uniref:Rv3235 family protein n=1 Tax=Streptomyces sp. NPDC000345 TaxID=3364537 RepID=UPI00367BFEC7
MNKVMTRLQHSPGTRPPGRRDPRRPAGTPPRTRQTRTSQPSTTQPASPRPSTTQPSTTQPSRAPRRPGQAPAPHPHPAAPPATAQPRPHTPAPPTAPAPARSPQRPPAQPRPTDLFADRLLAVLSGRRPVHSMLRHTRGRAYDDLADLAEHGPLRAAHGVSPTVRDIGYYVPRPGAIEAFARIGTGDRLRAMAFRLELGTDRRWRCTAVELGGPRRPHPQDD